MQKLRQTSLIDFDRLIDRSGSLGDKKSGNSVSPSGVMRGGSVSVDGLLIVIELEESEPVGIVDLLNHVEPDYTGFFPAVSGVRFCLRDELIQRIGLNLEIHDDGDHG
jgi:hypothetical protein